MRLLCSLLLSLFVIPMSASAQNQADEAAVRSLPKLFAAAWNEHNGHALARIMAEEVDFVNVGGDWLHGRSDFELYHSRLLSGRFKASTLIPLAARVKFLGCDLAVLHWSWKIEGDKNEDLTPRKPRYGLFTMIAKRGSTGWLITEAQNTNRMPGPNPELRGITPPIVFPADLNAP
jgi:uncharacterized protein (TIGR02246 family)